MPEKRMSRPSPDTFDHAQGHGTVLVARLRRGGLLRNRGILILIVLGEDVLHALHFLLGRLGLVRSVEVPSVSIV